MVALDFQSVAEFGLWGSCLCLRKFTSRGGGPSGRIKSTGYRWHHLGFGVHVDENTALVKVWKGSGDLRGKKV